MKDSLVPLEYRRRNPRKNQNFPSKPNTIGFKIMMPRDPPRDRGNPNPSVRSNGKANRCVVRGGAKRVTALPNHSSRGMEIKEDRRKNVDPHMIKLTKISPPHESRTIVRNFNKVMEKTFPQISKGFVKLSGASIR